MKRNTQTLKAIDPAGGRGELKRIGGSQSDTWNNLIVGQVVRTLWTKNSDQEERNLQFEGTISALIAISPRDEIEGMIASQLMGPPLSPGCLHDPPRGAMDSTLSNAAGS